VSRALSIATATSDDAACVTSVRNAAALHLTEAFGTGHWSGFTTRPSVLRGITSSRVLIAREGDTVVATLRLATKRPWAIDAAYFAPSANPLYLVDMAVLPGTQRQGAGRQLLKAAVDVARGWQKDAIRLDAYDHAAGAGRFYQKCGFAEVGRIRYRGVPLIYYQMLL